MNDINRAKFILEDRKASVVFCSAGQEIILDGKGIRPLLEIMKTRTAFSEFSVADKIVGKAAALLFVKMKVASVYGSVISEKAKEIFLRFNIPFSYQTLASMIINRKGDGMCPMEKAIENVSDPEEAYQILKNAVYQTKGGVV
mgnify:CR=1 FL=1